MGLSMNMSTDEIYMRVPFSWYLIKWQTWQQDNEARSCKSVIYSEDTPTLDQCFATKYNLKNSNLDF